VSVEDRGEGGSRGSECFLTPRSSSGRRQKSRSYHTKCPIRGMGVDRKDKRGASSDGQIAAGTTASNRQFRKSRTRRKGTRLLILERKRERGKGTRLL